MEGLVFSRSKNYTLGVELEFQIVDRKTLNLVPRAQSILATMPADSSRIALEFLQSIIEIQTGICGSVTDVAHDLSRSIHLVEDVAYDQKSILYAASLHPFAEPFEQRLSPGDRYERIMRELQYVGRQFISQGLHVHVGIGDGDRAVKVCDIIQAYLPILLALSSSSPYFRGVDTGFSSYRTKLFEALPLAGIFGHIGDWKGYRKEVFFLRKRKIIQQVKDLWWDVRPSPGYGTVEIRICDMPARFSETLGITAVIQALVAYIAEKKFSSSRVSLQLLRSNKWQAARHGLDGRFNDGLGILSKQTQTLRNAAAELFLILEPLTKRFQTQKYIDPLRNLLDRGTGAEFQRLLVSQGKSHQEMIHCLRNDYWLW